MTNTKRMMVGACWSVMDLMSPVSLSQQQQQQQIRHRSGRSRKGLYDGVDIRFGNKVSFSGKKTRRTWKPNVHKHKLYSEILDERIRFHATAKALRTIDKVGGLDEYLLRSKHVITDEGEGGKAKRRILNKLRWLRKQEEANKETGSASMASSATEKS